MAADTIVEAPSASVTYVARRSDLWLTHTPSYYTFGPHGNKTGETRAVRFEFTRGTLRVSPADFEPGGRFAASGLSFDEFKAWMRSHRLFGDMQDGFTALEESAPEPSEAELFMVADSAASMNVAMLERMQAEEMAGWKRPKMLALIERALENARAQQDHLAAQAAEPAAEPAKKATPKEKQ